MDDRDSWRPKTNLRRSCAPVGFAILFAMSACSNSSSDPATPSNVGGSQSGGSFNKGGASGGAPTTQSSTPLSSGSGGEVSSTTSQSGTSGGAASGGNSASGGKTASSGGVASGGNPSGGNVATGGDSASGGNPGSTGGSSTTQTSALTGGTNATGGNGSGSGGGSALAGASSTGGSTNAVGGATSSPQRMILCDEGNQRVAYLDLTKPSAGWQRSVTGLRDIQLVGNSLLGVSTSTGYVEIELTGGTIKKELKGFTNVQSFRRLPNGYTILGMETNGTTLQELDDKDAPVTGHKVSFPSLGNFRLFRRTPQGTFLVGAGNKLAEVNWNQETVWEMTFPGSNLYVYQGIRLANGKLAVSQGYGSTLLIVDPSTKTTLTTIGGSAQPEAAAILPNFYAGFQILSNGHFVITNWQGHGAGNGGKGIQLLEYDEAGKLVWKWKQDPNLVSSLHHIIVLDGLDTTKLHDDVNGILAPVTQ